MSSHAPRTQLYASAMLSALIVWLSACEVEFKDGLFACSSHADCPSGLLCDPKWKRCTRHPLGTADGESTAGPMDAGSRPAADSGAIVHDTASDSGRPGTASQAHADAAMPPAQSSKARDASQDTSPPTAADAATRVPAGGAASMPPTSAGGGGSAADAGSTAAQLPAACSQAGYCYGFESGALDPSGALWPSPSDGNGGLPANQELTTIINPPSSQNAMLVSRPSAKDGWPKATVGFSGPRTPFSKLVVSFDYIAGDTLLEPNPRVILFRFVGRPAVNGDSVDIGLLDRNAMLEVQMDGPDALSALGPATKPGVLTHVIATFTRGQSACSVEIAYGALPLKAAAFPCEVQSWQIELGLDVLETPPERYTYNYVAYFDNLQVSFTP